MTVTAAKEALHRMIDALGEDEAERLLVTFADPALRTALLAPMDDEPLTADDVSAIEEARAELARGQYVSDDELDTLLQPVGP